jgi:type IX secretion system PorP/SprF family membrane protein
MNYFHCLVMRKSLPLIILYMCFNSACAQTEPQFTQYMYNKYLFNPAYAGSAEGIDMSALYRNQYVGLTTRPIATEGFNVNAPIASASSGIGITAINDNIGLQRSTYVAINYDYRKNFSWGKMGIGIGAGMVESSLNGAELQAPDGNYSPGLVNHNDPNLPTTLVNGIAPDLSFGLYFNNDKYFAGASINHIAFSSAKISTPVGSADLNFARNLFLMGGYDIQLGKKLSLMPSAIVKTDFNQVQVDLAGTFTIIDNILAGISFRGYNKNTIDALSLIFGFRYRGFQFVYSYDANLSYLTNFNSGSHELSVNYLIGVKKKENKGYFYHNPRFD